MQQLRERWTAELLGRTMPLFDVVHKHQPMRDFAFDPSIGLGSVDGRVDLRGLPLQRLTSYRANRLDFSHSRSPANAYGQNRLLMVTACILDDCRFVDVSMFHQCAGTFRRCDFSKSKFVGGALIGQFEECVFDGANLSKAVLGDSFTRCTFRGVNFRRATMTMCRFVHCVFENCKLKDGWFGEDLNELPTESLTIFAPLVGPIRYDKTAEPAPWRANSLAVSASPFPWLRSSACGPALYRD